jgi:lipopolysaccharide transport system permease protein
VNVTTTVRSDDVPVTVHGTGRGFRTLLLAIVRRDLTVRYHQTLLGFLWALAVPLAQLLVFTLIFTRAVPVETVVAYPVYAFTGLLPWTFFASGLQLATTSLTGNLALVTKVALPREVFPVAALIVASVDFCIAATILAALMLLYNVTPDAAVLAVPVLLSLQLAFMAGLGLLLAVGNVYYRDIRYISGVLLMLWMFASAVIYPVERVGGTAGALLQLNPMTTLINGYRAALLGTPWPAPVALALTTLIALLTLWAGVRVFHVAERNLAEVI